jgi:hypothetical protein
MLLLRLLYSFLYTALFQILQMYPYLFSQVTLSLGAVSATSYRTVIVNVTSVGHVKMEAGCVEMRGAGRRRVEVSWRIFHDLNFPPNYTHARYRTYGYDLCPYKRKHGVSRNKEPAYRTRNLTRNRILNRTSRDPSHC